jgi:replicative DNA helicase
MQNSRNHQRLSQHQIDQAFGFIRKLKRLPFEVIQCRTSDTVQKLEAKMDAFLRRRANGSMPLFVFDHIRAIKPSVQGDEGTKALQIGQDIHDAMKARRSAGWVLQQRSTTGLKRENPRPASADLFGGDSAKQPFDVIFYVFRASEHRDEQVRTAKDEAEAEKVRNRFSHIYGRDRDGEYLPIDGFIEVGMIKNRFGNKSRRAILAFDAEYTRFSSRRQKVQEEMFG